MPTPPEKICPLCLRSIPPALESIHHLIPKVKGGSKGPRAVLHRICHKKIHKTIKEAELARSYSTPELLRGHPEIAKFIRWVSKRPPDFDGRMR